MLVPGSEPKDPQTTGGIESSCRSRPAARPTGPANLFEGDKSGRHRKSRFREVAALQQTTDDVYRFALTSLYTSGNIGGIAVGVILVPRGNVVTASVTCVLAQV
jgi:hypothetical protein